MYVFTETGSGTSTAILFVIELAVAVVLGPVGGSLIDRWDLKRTLVVTNVVQAVTVLPLLLFTPDRIWPAFVVAGVQSALRALNNPASVALLPRLVDHDQLTVANAAQSVTTAIRLYIVLFMLSGIPGSAMQVGVTTAIQTWSPPDVLGRAVGVLGASDAAGNALGSLLAGVLVDRVRLTALLDIQAAIYVLCGFVVILLTRRGDSMPGG